MARGKFFGGVIGRGVVVGEFRAREVRVEVEEGVGLGADEVMRGRGATAESMLVRCYACRLEMAAYSPCDSYGLRQLQCRLQSFPVYGRDLVDA